MPVLNDLKNTWMNLSRPPQPQQINIQMPSEDSNFMSNSAMGLGVAGAGAGAGAQFAGNKVRQLGLAGQRVLAPEGRAALKKFVGSTASGLPDADRFKGFINNSHDLLNTNVFRFGDKRVTGYDALEKTYGNPMLDKIHKMVRPEYKGMNPGTQEHYRAFAKSPLDGYKQLMHEQLGGQQAGNFDALHNTRMQALYKNRGTQGSTYLQSLADQMKHEAVGTQGLRPDTTPSVKGDQYYQKAYQTESGLRKADPKAYMEWRNNAKSFNAGGMLDEAAESTLKSQGQHLYGKANVADVVHDPNAFWRTLKPGMQQAGADKALMQQVLKSKDMSGIPKDMQSKILDYLVKNGPKLQNQSVVGDVAKSFDGGRAAYLGAAKGALKFDDAAKQMTNVGKMMGRGGRAGLIGGAGLAGAGLLGRMFGADKPGPTINLTVPPRM